MNFQEPPQSPYAYPVPARPAAPPPSPPRQQPSPYSSAPSPYSSAPSPYSAPVPPPPPSQYSRSPSSSSSSAQSRMDEMQTQPSNNQPQLLRSDVSMSGLLGANPARGILDKFIPESSKKWAVYGQLMHWGAFGPNVDGDRDSRPKRNKKRCRKIVTPPFYTCDIPPSRPPSFSIDNFDNPTDNSNKMPAEKEEQEISPFMTALAAFIDE